MPSVMSNDSREADPGHLTGCLLRAANGSHLSCFSHIVLLNVVRLRLRRPIRGKPNICLPFAALATKPGEKNGLYIYSQTGYNFALRAGSRQLIRRFWWTI